MKLRQQARQPHFTAEQRRVLHTHIAAIESALDQGAAVVPHDYPAIRALLDALRAIPDRYCTNCPPFPYQITVQDCCDRDTIRDLRDMVDCKDFTPDLVS